MKKLMVVLAIGAVTLFVSRFFVPAEAEHGGAHEPDPAVQGEVFNEDAPAPESAHGHHARVWETDAFWAQIAAFAALLYLIGGGVLGGANSFLQKRKQSIEVNLVEAKALREKAEATYKQYAARLAELDNEIKSLRAEMVKAGEAERDRIIAEAEGKAARMRRDTQFIIEQQLKQLRVDLKHDAAAAAIRTAEEILSSQLNDGDQERLAREFIDRLSSNESPAAQASAAQPVRGAVS
ncbi:MAG: ATP synthase F0 subunit B [Polyangiales bacterium]|nr:ATP synthase F0 subunit B [Myxococcales bacterium]